MWAIETAEPTVARARRLQMYRPVSPGMCGTMRMLVRCREITDRRNGGLRMGKNGDGHADVARSFFAEMLQLRLRAGNPTFKEIEKIARNQPGLTHLNSSTMNDILTGKRTRIPRLELVLSFVAVCRWYAAQKNHDLGALGSDVE